MTRNSLPTPPDPTIRNLIVLVLLFLAATLGIISAVAWRTFSGLSLLAVLLIVAALAVGLYRKDRPRV